MTPALAHSMTLGSLRYDTHAAQIEVTLAMLRGGSASVRLLRPCASKPSRAIARS